MYADFGLQVSVCVWAGYGDRGTLYPRFFTNLQFNDLGIELMLLSPFEVYFHEHLGPVLALDASGSGMDDQDSIVFIHLPGEEVADLECLDLFFQAFDFRLEFM